MRLWRLAMTIKREKPPPLRRGFGGGFCEFWLKFRGKFTPHAAIASIANAMRGVCVKRRLAPAQIHSLPIVKLCHFCKA